MSLSSDKEYESLAAAVAAMGSEVRTLEVANAVTVTSDLTVPQTLTLSFVLDGQISVAAGATLIILGPVCAPTRQIFSGAGAVVFGSGLAPRVYPQWWGAWSDGTHPTETTAAIQAAMNSLFTNGFQPSYTFAPCPGEPPQPAQPGDYLGSSQVVEFLAGLYAINDAIAVGSFANVITGTEAIIQQTDNCKNILTFADAYTVRISGLRFLGGAVQVALSNANVDTSTFQIDHCEFQVATKYAIAATPTPPATGLSALLSIDNCKFVLPAAVLQNYGYAYFNNSWVTVGSPPTCPNTAIFYNGTGGELHIYNMLGVPVFPTSNNGCRWIDNYGNVLVNATRFGGEDAGLPIVYNYAGPAPAYPWLGAFVEIRNSAVFVGQNSDPNAAVLNLQTNLPQVFIYEGNQGPANNPIVLNGGNIDLDAYLSGFPANQFRYVAEPNQWNGGPVLPQIPEPLRPLFNFLDGEKFVGSAPTSGVWKAGQRLGNIAPTLFGPSGFVLCQLPNNTTQWVDYGKSSPFPIGPQQAQAILPGPIVCDQPVTTWPVAKYSYNIPPTVSSFVAIVTFSANPNYCGSNSYRTIASFLISLTNGYIGADSVVDVLSSAPLFQPATPGNNLTSLGGLFFGNGNSGSNQRPTTPGGSFTVLWTNVSRVNEAYVTIEVLHLS